MKRKSKMITAALLLSLLLSLSFTLVGAEGGASPVGGVEAAYSEAALPNAVDVEGGVEVQSGDAGGAKDGGGDTATYTGADPEDGARAAEDPDAIGDNSSTPDAENSAKPDTGAGIEGGAEVSGTPDTGASVDSDTGDDGEGTSSFFEELYSAIMTYSAEITSALAAITSIILAVLMKRGLTPMLKDALSGMAGAVRKLGEGVSESEQHAKEMSAALTERLSSAEQTIKALSDTVSALESKREIEGEEQLLREDILTVMSAEVELLYDVFMSSALPQYKKNEVGERFAAMRRQLGYRGGSGDEA